MKRLLKYLKDYKIQCVLAPLFKMLEALFELFVPLVMADIIDKGIAGGNLDFILKKGLLLLLLTAIGLTCSVTAQYFSAKAATGFSAGLRSDLFRHIQSLAFANRDEIGTSTLITRLTSDSNQVQSLVNMVLRLFLRSPFIVFGAMIMAFTIDVKCALIFVVAIPLMAVVVVGITVLTMPMYRHIQNLLDQVLTRTRENLGGVRVIRAFTREKEELRRFGDANDRLSDLQLVTGRLSALTNPLTYIIVNAAAIVIIWCGAVRVDTGIITQGEVIALVNYMSQILVELIKLTNLCVTITKGLACANRIADVLDTETYIPEDGDGSCEPAEVRENTDDIISFDHVGLAYNGSGDESLSDINIRIKRGETVGIIGPTGSGKTSLVNLIPRFYDVTSGCVKIDGIPVTDLRPSQLRRRIGVVPQKAVLFKGTLRDNLRWGNPEASEEDMWKALEISQAADFVREKEGGLDMEISQGGKNLSGGQKQRLTIARAVIREPEILIMDDSASALDYMTDLKLRRAIAGLERDMTVIIVSQRTASVKNADHIIVMDDGCIAGQGTHEELLADCPVYREIYSSQYEQKEEA